MLHYWGSLYSNGIIFSRFCCLSLVKSFYSRRHLLGSDCSFSNPSTAVRIPSCTPEYHPNEVLVPKNSGLSVPLQNLSQPYESLVTERLRVILTETNHTIWDEPWGHIDSVSFKFLPCHEWSSNIHICRLVMHPLSQDIQVKRQLLPEFG